jgi:hypothetical protein
MRESVILALIAVVVLGPTSARLAAADAAASGRVVICSSADPIEDWVVTIWLNGSYYSTATTNANGEWSASVTLPNCDTQSNWITVTLGSSLSTSYTQDYCPFGKHGSLPRCCEQLAKQVVGCSPTAAMGDLEFRCGGAGEPGCPSQ